MIYRSRFLVPFFFLFLRHFRNLKKTKKKGKSVSVRRSVFLFLSFFAFFWFRVFILFLGLFAVVVSFLFRIFCPFYFGQGEKAGTVW